MNLEELILDPLPLVGSIKENEIPTPEEYDYWNNRNNRIFFIDYEIDDNYNLIELSKTILRINKEDMGIPVEQRKKIYIGIFSYGGDLTQALYFADVLIASKTPVVTFAMGATMSAGAICWLAGDKRYAFPHSQVLIHQGSTGVQGTAEEVNQAISSYKRVLKSLEEYILSRTNIDKKLWNRKKKIDWYLDSNELSELGIADKIVNSLDDIFE